MVDFLDMDSNKLVISEFYENDMSEKYDYSASYQREKVWSEEKKSFFIDSILKNFPIPPVFFRMKIDSDTGITKYDVIDGKQRLTTIRDFIDNKISLPDDFASGNLGNTQLNGAYFKDLDKFEKYKKQFWKYRIPIIFIDTDDEELVKEIFDRLNRNGEPLVPQELRHAKYGETNLYKKIEELVKCNIWKDMFKDILEVDRMEDKEFMSELLFLILEEKILSYTKDTLDKLYKKWVDENIQSAIDICNSVMNYISNFNLDYTKYGINKVSHLYAIWAIGFLGVKQNIDARKLGITLDEFYQNYTGKRECIGAEDYKKSMSSSTKGVSSRRKRLIALTDFCNSQNLNLKMNL